MRLKVDINKCVTSDLHEIAELEKKYIPNGWTEKGFSDWFKNNSNAVMFKAISEKQVIGFINGSWIIDEGELLNIAVDQRFRKRGVAAALLKAFEEYLILRNIKTIFLEVREKNNSAVKFYEKHGFIKIGFRKNYYKKPEDNGIVMRKSLR